jgi:hypothetical protein
MSEDLHADARPQGRFASLRDGLRPPLPPDTDEQLGWLSGRWLSHARGRILAVQPPDPSPATAHPSHG